MKRSIQQQLGGDLFFKLLTVFIIAMLSAILLLYILGGMEKKRMEHSLAESIGYSLQEAVRNRDLITITRVVAGYQRANKNALFCVKMNDGTVFAGHKDCNKITLFQYNIPFSKQKLKIGVRLKSPWKAYYATLFMTFMGVILVLFLSRIKKSGSYIAKEISRLGTKDLPEKFCFVEAETAQKKILEGRKHLLENEKLRGEVVLGHITTQVTHDLRGPLSSMEAALGELNKTPSTDPNYPTLLNILNLGSKRLKGIADDLLEKHTPKEKQKVLFSLHRVLDELIGEYQSQERCKEVKFEKENFSTAVALYGEPVKLQRAFGNILKNALEAMEFGFRIMGVHTRPTKQKLMAKNGDSSFAIRRPILRRVMGCRRPL